MEERHVNELYNDLFSAIGNSEEEYFIGSIVVSSNKGKNEAGKQIARQRGIVFGRRSGTNESKMDFLNKEGNQKILKYLVSGNYTPREINKITSASSAMITKVKTVAKELGKFNSVSLC